MTPRAQGHRERVAVRVRTVTVSRPGQDGKVYDLWALLLVHQAAGRREVVPLAKDE